MLSCFNFILVMLCKAYTEGVVIDMFVLTIFQKKPLSKVGGLMRGLVGRDRKRSAAWWLPLLCANL